MSKSKQGGYLIVALVAMVAIMMIASMVAYQEWADVVRRDNEAEMIFRAREIVRGIRRYQKDRGTHPLELKLLMEPGNRGQYFLRRLYKDPLVKDGKWGLLFAGPDGGILDPNTAESEQPDDIGSSSKAPPTMSGIGGGAPGGTGELKGLPIIGVKSLCKDQPFRIYRDQADYSRWLFTIHDLELAPGGQGQGQAGGAFSKHKGGVGGVRPSSSQPQE